MRIGLLSFEYPPETGFGGIGSYTWHHARGLAALGHDVHVLAGSRTATSLRSSEHDGVHVHRFWADDRLMRLAARLGGLKLWWTRQRIQNAWSMYQGVKILQRQHRFDVLEMPECGAEGTAITQLLRVPTVVRLHSPSRLIMPSYDVTKADTVCCAAVEQRALRRSSSITSCSAFLASEVREKLGIRRPIEVITNGLDLSWFDSSAEIADVYTKYKLPRRQLLIVFTGRMERRKGIHLMPEIAASVLERHDVTFALAGDDLFGYVTNTLEPFLRTRQLKGSLHWLGPLTLSDLRPLVRAADIFLLPSIWENCPYSCIEAMAAGRAVVAADQGGMPELIQKGENGMLASCGDASAFVRALEPLIADSGLRHRLGNAARRTVEQRHDNVHTARQAVAAYEEIA
jgi:glycosyltransferase involved in cell wall biosynthesis